MQWTSVTHIVIITAASIVSRFYKVCEPDVVSWDETHFGKFASFYLKNENYFDVHPPLGKMMLAGFGYMTGYNGSFSFNEPGQDYGDTPYCGLRMSCAMLGVTIPILLYGVVSLQVNACAGFLAAILIICDTGLITLTQFILLESPLFFFMCAGIFSYTLTSKLECFTVPWYITMASTGICVGCVLSVKYIGLFVVIYIGLQVVYKLYTLVCDTSLSLSVLAQHLIVRILLLIILPALLYLTFFVLHFAIIYKSTDSDNSYSPEYQASLEGNPLAAIKSDKYLHYGSKVRLRSSGMLLHSHHLTFPEEWSGLNQVTGYSYRDENNYWEITQHIVGEGLTYVGNGDIIRLKHLTTSRYMYCHDKGSYITSINKQIATSPEGDNMGVFWQVYTPGAPLGAKIETYSIIVLLHVQQRCAVSMGDKKLPDWAAGQIEVSCLSRWHSLPSSAQFIIEHNTSPNPAKNTEPIPRASFWTKFAEMQIKMLNTNNALIPKEDERTSRPWHWPIDYEGIWFAIHQKSGSVYFLGNPIIFWGNLLCIGLYIITWLCLSYGSMRNVPRCTSLLSSFSPLHWYMTGYLLHYIPFYMMGRVLYFHHFYSAFLFNCMLSGSLIDLLITLVVEKCNYKLFNESCLKDVVKIGLQGLLVGGVVGSFAVFCPLCYGIPVDDNKQTVGYMRDLKWMERWAF